MTFDLDHWTSYEPIEGVAGFDALGDGPSFERLQVTANCSTSPDYPECRIAIHLGRLGSGALTIEQSAELRRQLEHAESDVRAAMEQGAGVRPGQERDNG